MFKNDDAGRRAGSWARGLASSLGVALDVVVPPANSSAERRPDDARRFEAETSDGDREALRDAGIVVDSIKVVTGDFAKGIIGDSRVGDIVVLGVHHHEGLTHWALGSSPHALAHHLACALVLVPPTSDAPADAPIVVGLDGSVMNRGVVEWSKGIATAVGRDVEGVYASNPMYETFDNAGDYGEEERMARAEADTEGVRVHERAGDANDVLRAIAHERNAYLTVIGTREHHSFGGIVLGAVVDRFIRTPPGPIAIIPHLMLERAHTTPPMA